MGRGEREIDDEDEFEDNVKIPSCSELRKMWKIARRIHQHAIKTNQIPQKLHPFSNFESDRFRTSRRFSKNRFSKSRENKNSKTSKTSPAGSKETPETNYGTEKDSGSWTTKMIKFEPETPNIRAFDTLRNKLRQDKKLPPMPEKSFSKQKDYWGKIITHYKNKNQVK